MRLAGALFPLSLAFMLVVCESVAPEAVARYTFTSRACVDGIFDTSVGDQSATKSRFVRNVNTTTCGRSMGVSQKESTFQSSGIQSRSSSSDVLRGVMDNQKGVSIELWLKPESIAYSSDVKHPILTIGLPHSVTPPAFGFTSCDAEGFDFQLSQRKGSLEVAFRTSDAFIEPCQVYRLGTFPSLQPGQLVHVIVSLSHKKQQVFVNGRPSAVLSQSFSNDLRHWHADWRVKVFGYDYPVPTQWVGSIYELAIYPGPLSLEDVRTRLREGLPPAVPYTLNTSVVVNEDAEDIAGTHGFAWYQQEAPLDDIGQFELRYESLNKEVEDLQQNLGLTALKPLPPVFLYLTSLPAVGRLFQANGVPLEAADLMSGGVIPVSSVDGKLIYVPPLHSHSDVMQKPNAFASFTYCATDATIFNARQCQSTVMNIDVEPVNDPPTANKVDTVTMRQGNNTIYLPKIPLSGTDVDIGDSIRRVQITQPPAYGNLHLSVTSFRKDRLRHGTPTSDLDFIIPVGDPVYVNYLWRPGSSGVVVQAQGTKDVFRYRVEDQGGLWSAEEQVELQILSALTATVNQTIVVYEDNSVGGAIIWYGYDTSGFGRRVGFFVETVPSAREGILLDSETGKRVKGGSYLSAFDTHPYSKGVHVTFVPAHDFCTNTLTPELSVEKVAATFRVVAFNDNGDVVSVSEVYEQQINVECSTDVISLEVPTGPIMTSEFTLRRAATDPCRGYVYNSSISLDESTDCVASAIINGIQVKSRDRRSQRAIVTVLPGLGYVSFLEDMWSYVILVAGRLSVGSGAVSFLAYPEDLTKVFTGLHFHSYIPGVHSIDIILSYGDCPPITDMNNQSLPTISPACQVLFGSIELYVEADDTKYKAKEKLGGGFPWQIILCLTAYPCMYYLYVRVEILVEGDDGLDLPPWIQHRSDDGMFYYENTADGSVTWMAPVGENFVPWKEA